MQGNPFLSAAPEPFLVRRAKRVRGIFSTLLTIFLGPTGWKLQCSYRSFYQGEGRFLLRGSICAMGVRGTRGTLHWQLKGWKGFRALAWPPDGEWASKQTSKKINGICLVVLLQPEYFVRVEKGISVLISLRLKGMGKLDKNMETWNRNMLKIFQLNSSEQCLLWVIYWMV